MGTVTSNGYERTSLADLRTQLQDIYKNNYGSNFVTDPATPQGQMLENYLTLFDNLEDDKVNLNNLYDLDLATGVSLDKIGAIIGIPREEGKASQVIVDITSNTVGYTIPANTEFNLLNEPDIVYINNSDILITTLNQQITLSSKINQNYDISTGDFFETVQSFPEISSIQVDTYIDGVDFETDEDYLSRIKLLRSGAYRQSGVQRVSTALFEVDGVIDARVYSGSGSINSVVLGGAGADIANSILDTLDAGIDTTGAESEVVTDFQGLPVTINYDTADELLIGLNLGYKLKGSTDLTAAEIQDIKDRYIEFCQQFLINEKMATSDFNCIVTEVYGEKIYITTLEFIEAATPKQIIEPNLKSYIRADQADLTVQLEI